MNLHYKIFQLLVILTFTSGFLISIIQIPILNLLDDVVFILLLFFSLIIGKGLSKKVGLPIYLLCSYLVFSIFYSLSFGNELATVLLQFRQFKSIFLVFIISTITFKYALFVFKAFGISLYISVPFAIYQFITADRSIDTFADEVVGIFGLGQSGTLSLLILIYVFFEFIKRLNENKKLIGYYLILLVPCLINETKIIFMLIPVTMAVLFFSLPNLTKLKLLKVIPYFFVFALAANFSYMSMYGQSFLYIFNSDFLESYFFIDEEFAAQEIDIGRFMRVIYAYDYLEANGLQYLLFGEGIGSSFYGAASGTIGNAADYFFDLDLHTGSRIQLYQMLLDFGLVGSFLIVFTLLYYCFMLIKFCKNQQYLTIALSSCFIMLIALVYQLPLTSRVLSFVTFFFVMYVMHVRGSDAKKI